VHKNACNISQSATHKRQVPLWHVNDLQHENTLSYYFLVHNNYEAQIPVATSLTKASSVVATMKMILVMMMMMMEHLYFHWGFLLFHSLLLSFFCTWCEALADNRVPHLTKLKKSKPITADDLKTHLMLQLLYILFSFVARTKNFCCTNRFRCVWLSSKLHLSDTDNCFSGASLGQQLSLSTAPKSRCQRQS